MTSIKFQVRLAALLLVVAVATTLAIAQTPAPTTSVDTLVRAEIAPFKGKVYLFAKNLDTGATYSFNGDERVRTASTIKVAVMIEAFTRVAEGKAKWTDELVLTKAARYGGSGLLSGIAQCLRLSPRDRVDLMIVVRRNTAPHMVLDYLDTDAG